MPTEKSMREIIEDIINKARIGDFDDANDKLCKDCVNLQVVQTLAQIRQKLEGKMKKEADFDKAEGIQSCIEEFK